MLERIGMQSTNKFEKMLQLNRTSFFNFVDGEKIIDLGGGDGNVWSHKIKDKIKLNIDLVESDAQLRSIAKKTKIYNNIFDNISKADFSNYDSVTCFNVLEHIQETDNFLNSLMNSKKIHFTVPNANSFHRMVGVEKKILKNIYELNSNDLLVGHVTYFDKERLLKTLNTLLKKSFEISKFGSISFKFLSNSQSEAFIEVFNEINRVAEYTNLIGENNFYGAELAISLTKKG